jgi:hypothetical protein
LGAVRLPSGDRAQKMELSRQWKTMTEGSMSCIWGPCRVYGVHVAYKGSMSRIRGPCRV